MCEEMVAPSGAYLLVSHYKKFKMSNFELSPYFLKHCYYNIYICFISYR